LMLPSAWLHKSLMPMLGGVFWWKWASRWVLCQKLIHDCSCVSFLTVINGNGKKSDLEFHYGC
jgi:hypothetical protein